MDEGTTTAAAEIPETAAPPIEELVSGEAPPPSDGARAQIPEPEPAPVAAATEAELPPPMDLPDASEWRDVAAGRVSARRRKRGQKGAALEGAPEAEPAAPSGPVQLSPQAQQEIREAKAKGYVQLAEFGMLYLARRWSVAESEIQFTDDERRSLSEAVAPLVSAEPSDPWTNLFGVALVTVGPRVQTLAAAAKANKAAAAQAAAAPGGAA